MDLITLALAKKYTNKKFEEVISFGGFKIVDVLPTVDISTSVIYLLKTSEGIEGNIYTEYVYTTDGQWEALGTNIDLRGLEENIDTMNEKLDQLTLTMTWGDF